MCDHQNNQMTYLNIDKSSKGPSINPLMTSTRRGRGKAQVDACGRGEGVKRQAPCGRPHRKLKIESTDVILSSSHAKKLVFFLPELKLSFDGIKSGKFSAI